MKEFKVLIHPNGDFDIDAVSGFAGTQCHEEIQKIVLGTGATVVEEKKKDEYWKDAPEYILQKQR